MNNYNDFKDSQYASQPYFVFLPPLLKITHSTLSTLGQEYFIFFEFNCFYKVKKIKKSCPFARPRAKAELLTHISTFVVYFF